MQNRNKFVQLQDVMKLHSLFTDKDWFSQPNNDSVFENYCQLLDNLAAEQKELIFELSQNYLWISGSQYEVRFNNIFNKVRQNIPPNCRTVYLIPVIKPSEKKRIKSGDHCVYLMKGILALNSNYSNIFIKVLDDYDKVKKWKFQIEGSEIVMFIDDFIGTGDSFMECWADLSANDSVTIQNSILISLVIQNEGKEVIGRDIGIDLFFGEERTKGITEFYKSPVREEKIRIMKEIERVIKPGAYSFGYKGSEALVTMINTPNNTFPVFWKKYSIGNDDYSPPFKRS